MMVGVVGALSAFYQDSLDIANPEHRKIAIYRLISKIPTIAAMCYRYSNGLPFNYPKNNLSYAENFLHMMFATPCEEYKPNPVLARALDRILFCMPTTSKTPLLRPYVWPALLVRTHLPVSLPVSPVCGVLHTAVQTKLC